MFDSVKCDGPSQGYASAAECAPPRTVPTVTNNLERLQELCKLIADTRIGARQLANRIDGAYPEGDAAKKNGPQLVSNSPLEAMSNVLEGCVTDLHAIRGELQRIDARV